MVGILQRCWWRRKHRNLRCGLQHPKCNGCILCHACDIWLCGMVEAESTISSGRALNNMGSSYKGPLIRLSITFCSLERDACLNLKIRIWVWRGLFRLYLCVIDANQFGRCWESRPVNRAYCRANCEWLFTSKIAWQCATRKVQQHWTFCLP